MKKLISLCLCITFAFTSCDFLYKEITDLTQSNGEQTPGQSNEQNNEENNEENNEQNNEQSDEIINYYKALALYNQYLDDKALYDQKKSEYENYLRACEKYAEALIEYEEYLSAYNHYISIKTENEEKEAQYQAELDIYNKLIANSPSITQVQQLDSALFSKVTYLEREIYAALFSDLANEVIAQKDKLTTGFGKDMGPAIDNCAVATNNLRAILKPEGAKAYTELETTEEKYSFYANNYEALRDNVYALGNSLYTIYSAQKAGVEMPTVMNTASKVLGREDYTERLAIFIAQLICLAEALDDSAAGLTFDSGTGGKVKSSEITFYYYDINGNSYNKEPETIKQLLGDDYNFVIDTNSATPGNGLNIEKPVKPTLEVLPPEPATVIQPTEPIYVPHPGTPPEVVDEPIPPNDLI